MIKQLDPHSHLLTAGEIGDKINELIEVVNEQQRILDGYKRKGART